MLSRNASKSNLIGVLFPTVLYYKNMNEPTIWGQDYYWDSPTANSRCISEEFLDYGANGNRGPHRVRTAI